MKTASKSVVFLCALVVLSGLLALSCQEQEVTEEPGSFELSFPEDGQEALQRLVAGNERFVSGQSLHTHESQEWRSRLTRTQKPFATVLGCSDSRVPIELLFDQGFGDLFIIRVAGNVLGPDERGSIAYALAHLHTPLVLVLGHEGCGAVTAALLPDSVKAKEPPFLQMLLQKIEPAVANLDMALPDDQRLRAGVEANVHWSVQHLQDRLNELESYENVLLQGAVYELETGKVRVIK